MKKIYFLITIIMFFAFLSGISHLAEGICARGPLNVNYGIVGFPLLIGIWAFYKYKKN